jgi:hypothetical protein
MTTSTMMKKSPVSVAFKGADESGEIEVVFATLNVIDKDGDYTLPGAFTESAPVVMSSYGHTSWDGDLPIGAGTIHEVGEEAIMRGKFFTDTPHGLAAYRTVKALSELGLQEWSYSLHNVVSKRGEVDGVPVNFLESIDVKEVSPVLVGAGVNTRTLAVKGAGMKFSEHVDAVLADVAALEERAARIMALRASKGKSLATASAAAIDRLAEAVTRLKDVANAATITTPTPEDELAVEYLRFIEATNQERFHP